MKQTFTLLFIILLSTNLYSQEKNSDSILTEKQNAEWIMELEKLNSETEKITKIKKKIYSDTVYKSPQNNCRIVIKNQESIQEALGKANCECKILFILSFQKTAYLLDPNEFSKTHRILELITENTIDKITVLKGKSALALYGSRGRCGVVVMYPENRKLKRKIKKVLQ